MIDPAVQNVDYVIEVTCPYLPDDEQGIQDLIDTAHEILDEPAARPALACVPLLSFDESQERLTLTWIMQRAGDLREVMHFFGEWLDSGMAPLEQLLPLITAPESTLRVAPLEL